MPKDYSEDQLIQLSAAELLEKELGWTSVYAFDKEVLGSNGTLGRTSYHEVLLTARFCKALKTPGYQNVIDMFSLSMNLEPFSLQYNTLLIIRKKKNRVEVIFNQIHSVILSGKVAATYVI